MAEGPNGAVANPIPLAEQPAAVAARRARQAEDEAIGALGARVRDAIDAHGQGGQRWHERRQDALEAYRCLRFVQREHPSWRAAMGGASGIADPRRRDELAGFTLFGFGSTYLQAARLAVEKYDKFIAENADHLTDEARVTPTSAVVAWFLHDRQLMARERAEKEGRACKGTTAHQLVSALGKAAKALGAPFPPILLEAPEVAAAAATAATLDDDDGERAAHWPVAFQLAFEHIAASDIGGDITAQTRRCARDFALMGMSGLRTIEWRRSKLRDFEPGLKYAIVVCDGGKPGSMRKLKPFLHYLPAEGFSGPFGWFAEWCEEASGKAYLTPDFEAARGHAGDPRFAVHDVARIISKTHLDSAFAALVAMPPLAWSTDDLRAAHVTPYGSRHLLPDVTRRAGWPLDDRNELGSWAADIYRALLREAQIDPQRAGRAARRNARVAMPNHYSRGPAACGRQLELRHKAAAIVRAFVGDAPWHERVPMQRGQGPSFDFLYE